MRQKLSQSDTEQNLRRRHYQVLIGTYKVTATDTKKQTLVKRPQIDDNAKKRQKMKENLFLDIH